MIPPLDPQTKKFYMEMGNTEQQVLRAYEYSKRNKVEMFDALAILNSSKQPPPPPPKQQNNYIEPQQQGVHSFSFLIPYSRIKQSDYEVLFSRNNRNNQLNLKYELREANNPVGLLNISNCCYLNSLLQCYFLMNDFKVALLTAEPLEKLEEVLRNQSKTKVKRIKNEYELLKKLKKFFTLMSLTSRKYLDPSEVLQNLVDSVGDKLSYGEEKDLSEINIMIIERLSEGLSYSQKYYEQEKLAESDLLTSGQQITKKDYGSLFNPKSGSIKKLFYGTKAQYYEQSTEMHSQPPIISDFAGIIINPHHGTLYRALDEQFNFKVEIKGKYFNKQMFIRQEPEYLFMYINRTQYDRDQGQMLKNDDKFTFDFVIYMDRYLEKYRKEKDIANERIKELIIKKNRIKEQMNYLNILFKKLEECYKYVKQLEGWEEKLPKQQQFEEEYAKLETKLNEIEIQLKDIESRKEEYHLMYIFVHRGDAVSGHYWGYGRNGENWYRFDINCRKIQQEQIIIDMQKSSATPYALLYVKQKNIPQFSYQHYLSKLSKSNIKESDFRSCIDPKMSEEIIRENMLIHQEIQIKLNDSIRKKTYTDYLARYNGVKKVASKWKEDNAQQKSISQLEIYNNFSLFLYSKGEVELCKFSLFEQSLIFSSGSKMTVEKLMQDSDLLGKIQKKFKKCCKGEYYLKYYSLMEKELARYGQLQQEYQLNVFEMIWGIHLMEQFGRFASEWQSWNPQDKVLNTVLQTKLQNIMGLIKIRNNLMKSEECRNANHLINQPLYISQICNEIIRLVLLKLAIIGIKNTNINVFVEIIDPVSYQIATINSGNGIVFNNDQSQQWNIISPIEASVELTQQFYAKIGSKISSTGSGMKTSVDRRSSARKQSVSDQPIPNSPYKSSAFVRKNSESKSKYAAAKLITYSPQLCLLTTIRETWRLEELDHSKINYDFSNRLLNFLKRIAPIIPLYKKIVQRGKHFSIAELKSEGVVLNQPVYEESLI